MHCNIASVCHAVLEPPRWLAMMPRTWFWMDGSRGTNQSSLMIVSATGTMQTGQQGCAMLGRVSRIRLCHMPSSKILPQPHSRHSSRCLLARENTCLTSVWLQPPQMCLVHSLGRAEKNKPLAHQRRNRWAGMRPNAKLPAPKQKIRGDSAAEDHMGCDAQDGLGRSHAWWWLHHMKFDQGPNPKKMRFKTSSSFTE